MYSFEFYYPLVRRCCLMTHLSEIEQASFGNHESRGHRCILKHGLSTCGSLDPEAAAAPLGPFGDHHPYSLPGTMAATQEEQALSPLKLLPTGWVFPWQAHKLVVEENTGPQSRKRNCGMWFTVWIKPDTTISAPLSPVTFVMVSIFGHFPSKDISQTAQMS